MHKVKKKKRPDKLNFPAFSNNSFQNSTNGRIIYSPLLLFNNNNLTV